MNKINKGRVRFHKPSGKYLVEFPIGIKPDGRKNIQFKYFTDEESACNYLLDMQIKFRYNKCNDYDKNMTISQWLQLWMKSKSDDLKSSSMASYYTNIKCHIDPVVGGVKLIDFNKDDYEQVITVMEQQSRCSSSLKIKVRTILSSALTAAEKEGLILCNPILGAKNISEDSREIQALTAEQQKDFVKVIQTHPDRVLMLTYLYTGMRLGEAIPLLWSDVCLKENNNYISITKDAITVYDCNSKSTKLVIQSPKTKSSIRNVVVPEPLAELLLEHRQKQQELYRRVGRDWSNSELVFPNSHFKIQQPRNVQEKFTNIMKKIGVTGIGIHSLRHTYATSCGESDIDINVYSKQLGHKNTALTASVYTHARDKRVQSEMSKLLVNI